MKGVNILISVALLSLFSCSDESGEMVSSQLDEATISGLVDRHNFYRSEVGVNSIQWSDDLAKSANTWAKKLKKNCELLHSDSGNGENLWMGTADVFTVNNVVDSWGSEKAHYNYEDNSCSVNEVCGHYTQIVWKNSSQVGCAVAVCDGFEIWVCQYNPPGNFIGEKPY